MCLSRKDFTDHGHTDGRMGCRDISSGKRGQIAPHTAACRKRMEEAVKERDPGRWERLLLRRRQRVVAREKEERPADPDVRDDEDEQGSLYGGWEHRDPEEVASLQASSASSGDLGAATPLEMEASKEATERMPGRHKEATRGLPPRAPAHPEGLIEHIRAVGMCDFFSPPRVSHGAAKFGIDVGDAMDLTTGWDFIEEADRGRAEEYVDKEKPLVLIGSPPSVAFSQLQALIPESDCKAQRLANGGGAHGVRGESLQQSSRCRAGVSS